MKLTIHIEDAYYQTFLDLLKTLDYVEIVEQKATYNGVGEAAASYEKLPPRPSADEIEQLIIKKALLDAKKIERGELELRTFNSIDELITDLEAGTKEEAL